MKEGGNYIPELNLTEDLVIKVIETPHPKYKRNGSDLIIEEKITLVEALCGVELKIEHLQGPLQVEIKEIVNPNQMFQVFGKGMPIKQETKALTEDEQEEKEFGNLIIDLRFYFFGHFFFVVLLHLFHHIVFYFLAFFFSLEYYFKKLEASLVLTFLFL